MILVINQPSRIIITNIHANPGIPIQNQPTGVPSLVPNQRPEKIENYAVLSIFSLICCCFPIGLLASLMSFQVYDDPCPHLRIAVRISPSIPVRYNVVIYNNIHVYNNIHMYKLYSITN